MVGRREGEGCGGAWMCGGVWGGGCGKGERGGRRRGNVRISFSILFFLAASASSSFAFCCKIAAASGLISAIFKTCVATVTS